MESNWLVVLKVVATKLQKQEQGEASLLTSASL